MLCMHLFFMFIPVYVHISKMMLNPTIRVHMLSEGVYVHGRGIYYVSKY